MCGFGYQQPCSEHTHRDINYTFEFPSDATGQEISEFLGIVLPSCSPEGYILIKVEDLLKLFQYIEDLERTYHEQLTTQLPTEDPEQTNLD
jgi:hypothetical protein